MKFNIAFKVNLNILLFLLLTCVLNLPKKVCGGISLNVTVEPANNRTFNESKIKNNQSSLNDCGTINSSKLCDEDQNITAIFEPRKKYEATTPSWFARPSTSGFQYLNLPGSIKGNHDITPCKRPAQCEPLLVNVSTCFGAALSHRLTSVELVGRNATQSQIQKDLIKWQNSLKNIPKCWAMIQTLLCAVYMPRCDNGMVDLPSQDMCKAVRGPCRVIEETVGWPSFLRCDHESNFPTQCKAEPRELRFNTTAKCPPFLVATDNAPSYYDGWDGCGVQCHNPLYTDEERSEVRTLISILGTICLSCSLFTLITFAIDWNSAKKYPALIILYINICFFMITIGWMAQFTAGARDEIVCRKNILRIYEPSSGENFPCVIVFVLIYYFLMAASIWFVILTYSWCISFQALGKIRETITAKASYFHIAAWSLPLILTIACLASSVVDGESVNGICFVGYQNVNFRIGLVLLPIFLCISAGVFFLLKGLIVLIKLKLGSDDIISVKASTKIRETITRLIAFTVVIFFIISTTVICHFYEYFGRAGWNSNFRKYIACKSNLTKSHFNESYTTENNENCQLNSRPDIIFTQLQLFTLFGTGIFMSTWIWTKSTFETWKRFIRRTFNKSVPEPVKLAKHKMIAKAFAQRNGGHLSFSFQSTHDDPLGMKFDLNSVASHEISSNWHAVLPKFIARRGAFDDGKGGRRNSSTSDMSHQKASNDSQGTRRHSLDSQISVHMSEQERRTYLANARQQRRKRKKGFKGKSGKSRVVPMMGVANLNHPRRGSDTSQHSDFGHLIPHHLLPAKLESIDLTASAGNHVIGPNVGHSRSSFRIHPLIKPDREMSNLKVETISMQLPHLVGDGNFNLMTENALQSLMDDNNMETSRLTDDLDNFQQLEGEVSDSSESEDSSDCESDMEMMHLNGNHSNLRVKVKPAKETGLNNCVVMQAHDADSTVVDMNMDDDNRDSISS